MSGEIVTTIYEVLGDTGIFVAIVVVILTIAYYLKHLNTRSTETAPTFNARTGATQNMNVNTLLNAGNQKLSSESSYEQVEVGVANFVAQSSSKIDNNFTNCEFTSCYSSSNCPRPSDDSGSGVSGLSANVLVEDSTISRDYIEGKYFDLDLTSQQPFDDARITKNSDTHVGTTLALAQSGSHITQKFYQSQIHMTSSIIQQSADTLKKTEGRIRLFKYYTADRNRIIIWIKRDEESVKKEKQVDTGYTTYFERSKEEVIVEYTKDRNFVAGNSSNRSFEPLTYDKLIDDIKDRRCKRLSLVGPAGYGKSTLIARLERDLSKVLDSEKLVVFLNFRDLKNAEKISPCELFFQSLNCDRSIIEDGYKWLVENQENVLFLLDGLDQFPDLVKRGAPHIGQYSEGTTSEIISNIFAKRLFPDVQVVYTSREHAVSALDGDLRPDEVISIAGLSSDNAKYLFTKELENGEQHWDNMAASLKPLLSIPAFLTFTKYGYERDLNNPPSCLTEIMQKLFSSFDTSDHNRREDILSENKKKALGKLSYDGLEAGNLTFEKEDFTNVGLDWDQIIDFVILVPGYGVKNRRLFDVHKVAIFLHQTIQEFFSGKHIVQMDKESFKNTVEQKLVDDYWSVVTRFVAGLLLNKKSILQNVGIFNHREKQEILKEMLKSKYGRGYAKGTDVASVVSTLASIAETEDSDFIQSFVESISLNSYPVGISGMSSVATIIRYSKHLKALKLISCGLGTNKVRLLWENVKGSGVKISRLDISDNKLDANCCEIIGNTVTECSVDELLLEECGITDAALERLLAMCKGAKISILHLSLNEFDAKCCEIIGNIVTKCSVDKLILQDCRITDATLKRFMATCISTKISKLDLSFNEFDANCCKIIGNIVAKCSVDKLLLRNCKITDAGLRCFLIVCKRISKLDLSQNEFDDDCCEIIGIIVAQCSVDELILRRCKITDAALEFFLAACKGAKLSTLNVWENCLSQAAIERIGESVTVENLEDGGQWYIPVPSDTEYEDNSSLEDDSDDEVSSEDDDQDDLTEDTFSLA